MAKLSESEEVLERIREKAMKHAIEQGTYETKSEFSLGRRVVSFSELCNRSKRRAVFQ